MRPFMEAEHFRLGTIATNCAGGMTPTRALDRWDNGWDNNLALAKMLDAAGVDFMLPVARWSGHGGETDFHGNVLDPLTWAAALLALTERLTVFATMHAAACHPVVAAKQIATADQVGRGRIGLDIVVGCDRPEAGALGLTASDGEAGDRHAQEWLDIVLALWAEPERFDWDGERFNLRRVVSEPKPVDGRPPILTAAGAPQGRAFAARNADFVFLPAADVLRSKRRVADLKAGAGGRDVGVLTACHICCRPTEAEARDFHRWYAHDNADRGALDSLSADADPPAPIRDPIAAGRGGLPLVGTPAQVAAGLAELAQAGFAGTALSFLDYLEEFPYFRDEVMPILAENGLRPGPDHAGQLQTAAGA